MDKPFRKGKGARDMGDTMPSCAFLLDFLEKEEDKKQREQGIRREGMQGYALGTLWEKPFRKGKGGQETGGIPCLRVPDYWTFLRKRRQKGEEKG